jgi:transposase
VALGRYLPRPPTDPDKHEQKADAVQMARELGNTSEIALRLELTESSLRNWMKQADIDDGNGPDGALTSDERSEFHLLRIEVGQLKQERDFLKKATAFFAKESERGREGQLPHRSDVPSARGFS